VKQFVIYIIRFLLPVLAVVIILMVIPVDKRLRYKNINDDCYNHGIWIHDRIFENPAPVDIAFIGSSHTINGINEKRIQDSCGVNVSAFGYCRLGANLYYVLAKDLLKKKKPKAIILEVREVEDRYSHPVFSYLADEEDVFAPYLLYNRDIVKNYYNAIVFKMQIWQEICFGSNINSEINMSLHTYEGFADTANTKSMDIAKQKRSNEVHQMNETERNFHMKFPRHYLNKIHELAEKNNIPLFFLYMPQYGSSLKEPSEIKTYQQLGKVWIPPMDIYEDKNNWYDDGHLNRAGANKLSDWVTRKIKAEVLK
jgi:hypothetical protein